METKVITNNSENNLNDISIDLSNKEKNETNSSGDNQITHDIYDKEVTFKDLVRINISNLIKIYY